jgi:hypothetical protein
MRARGIKTSERSIINKTRKFGGPPVTEHLERVACITMSEESSIIQRITTWVKSDACELIPSKPSDVSLLVDIRIDLMSGLILPRSLIMSGGGR